MKMDDVIARINELAKKAKTDGLTPEETVERDKLRRIYIDSVKASLTGQLDNTYIVYPDGTKKKVEPKEDSSKIELVENNTPQESTIIVEETKPVQEPKVKPARKTKKTNKKGIASVKITQKVGKHKVHHQLLHPTSPSIIRTTF